MNRHTRTSMFFPSTPISNLHVSPSPWGGMWGARWPSVTLGGWAQARFGLGLRDTPGREGRREGPSRRRDGMNEDWCRANTRPVHPAHLPRPTQTAEGTGSGASCCHWEHSSVLSLQGPCLVSGPARTSLQGVPMLPSSSRPSPELGPLSPPPGGLS